MKGNLMSAIATVNVTLTDDVLESFPAILIGEWNGFASPAFSRETVADVAEYVAWCWERNGVATVSINDDDSVTVSTPDSVETFAPVVIEGETYFPIGAGSWCWAIA